MYETVDEQHRPSDLQPLPAGVRLRDTRLTATDRDHTFPIFLHETDGFSLVFFTRVLVVYRNKYTCSRAENRVAEIPANKRPRRPLREFRPPRKAHLIARARRVYV